MSYRYWTESAEDFDPAVRAQIIGSYRMMIIAQTALLGGMLAAVSFWATAPIVAATAALGLKVTAVPRSEPR